AGGLGAAALGACATSGRAYPDAAPAGADRRALQTPIGEVQADFGKVSVPAGRGDSASGRYELAYVWLRSPNRDQRAPVIYLEGGPGSPATWMADNAYGLNHI